MTILIAVAAIGLLAAVTIAAGIGIVSAAIRREEKHHTLTGEPPDQLAWVGRRLNGVYVRTSRPTAAGDRTRQPLSPPAGPASRHRTAARAGRSRGARAFTPRLLHVSPPPPAGS